MYKITLYNNSDSVLCILPSAFGKYRKEASDTLSILSNKNYDISYALLDSKFDPFTPLKKKLCILPHQELNFTVRLEELKPNSFLRLQYFYSNDYSLNKDTELNTNTLNRIQDIDKLNEKDKELVFEFLDSFISNRKIKKALT